MFSDQVATNGVSQEKRSEIGYFEQYFRGLYQCDE